MNRRFFLKSGGVALASVGAAQAVPSFLRRAALAQGVNASGGRRKVLIAIFQRGAVDGLNVVVPHGESSYYSLRPTLRIAQPKGAGASAGEAAIDLDGFFGLHPSLASLKPLWDAKRLAVVHAVPRRLDDAEHAARSVWAGPGGRRLEPGGLLHPRGRLLGQRPGGLRGH